jgi:hypothetical protein
MTQPSETVLRKLVVSHGGLFMQHYSSKSVTHIITSAFTTHQHECKRYRVYDDSQALRSPPRAYAWLTRVVNGQRCQRGATRMGPGQREGGQADGLPRLLPAVRV